MVGHRLSPSPASQPIALRVELALNPLSRRGAHYSEVIRSELQRLGVEIVDEGSGVDAIVVGGGDGSLVRQIPRVLDASIPIGIVPLGTFNDLARTLRIPLDPRAACAVIAAGRTRAIDVARVNGAYYVTEASIGISSRIARRQRPEDKRRFGFGAIFASLVYAMRYARPFQAEVAFDGRRERVRAIQLTVANSQRFGGFITVEDAAIDDGRLECYSVEIENVAEFFRWPRPFSKVVADRRELVLSRPS